MPNQGQNIKDLIEKQASIYPDKAAIIFQDVPITFKELRDTVFCLANNLLKYGVKKGDKVALYLPNWPQYIYSYLALFSIGATVVPFDFMLKNDELQACLNHCEAKLLIARAKEDVSLEILKRNVPSLKDIVLVHGKTQEFLSFEDFVANGSTDAPKIEINDADPSLILYTSGSTGRPKGVLLNYRHLSASPAAMDHFVDLSASDVKLSALPLSHAGGLVYIQNCIFYAVTVVLMDRFIPLEFLKNIEKYKVTCFHMVPSMYYALLQLKEFEKFDLTSIRWVNVFGAPNSPETIRRFKTYCPKAKLLNGWGMTETCAPNTVIPMGSDKIESIGRPAPWVQIRLVDDSNKDVPGGEVGELIIKSWVVMDGYYKDPELTKDVMKDGWFYTGDLARCDSEGLYYIVGRKKDMIKVAGQIVFPAEIEEVLHKHPQIKEAAVIGVADQLRGEAVKAIIVLNDGTGIDDHELRQFCRKHLAHFKLPHSFEVVESLPKNRAGKVDKIALKRQ